MVKGRQKRGENMGKERSRRKLIEEKAIKKRKIEGS